MKEIKKLNNLKYNNWRTNLKESRLKRAGRLILSERPGRLLDIGCNCGEFSAKFLKKGWVVFGIDSAPKPIRIAKSLGINAQVADVAKRLPYKTSVFDLVFAGEVIEHIVDTTAFLKESHRVLKRGGKLILTTPNLASLENRLRLLLGMQPLWVDFKSELSSGHIRAYTLSALKEQLALVGFKIEITTGNFIPFWQLRWNDLTCPWLAKTGSILPSLSQSLIIKARK